MVNLTHSTCSISESEIDRKWHLIDLKGKVLGRVATEIISFLTGKCKTNYVSYLDMGDNVVLINASCIMLTGKKMKTKEYQNFSGYPGGLKITPISKVLEKKPEFIIRHAVSGMLPKNKLRDRRLARLHIFAGNEHNFSNYFV